MQDSLHDVPLTGCVGVRHLITTTRTKKMSEEIKVFVESYLDRELEGLVHEKVKVEEEQRFRQLKWIVIFLGVVGLGSMSTLANYFIEKAVDERITRAAGNISDSIEFSKFFTVTLKLELGTQFSQEDVDLIMNYLRKVEKKPEIRLSKEFRAALYQVTKSFTSAGQSSSLDEIFKMYEREIISSPTLVSPLLHHYGQEIVGGEQVTEEDSGYHIFVKLERVAADSRVPELALAYRTLFESKKPFAKNSKIVESYLKRSLSLEDLDRSIFFNTILRRANADNWVSRPTPQAVKIQDVVREFLRTYKSALNVYYDLDQVPNWSEIVSGGLDDDTSEIVSKLIADAKR